MLCCGSSGLYSSVFVLTRQVVSIAIDVIKHANQYIVVADARALIIAYMPLNVYTVQNNRG